MCTALSLNTDNSYFGRTLDIDRSYGEEVCIVPRRFSLRFRKMGELKEHYAIMGMATVVEGIPLFYDALNEHGLAMAGLNFPENAFYAPLKEGSDNVASFEFIPWILSQCKSVEEAEQLLCHISLCNMQFSEGLPNSPLHWMICDGKRSLTVEAMKDGLHIHENKVGVLTNNPPFRYQLENLNKYTHLRTDNREVRKEAGLPYATYCQGLGAVGLPGDVSSMSRFVRAAFGRANSVCEGDEPTSVGQFFHILSSVEMIRGACITDGGAYDITVYTSCMNLDKGLYYYTAYGNRRISCVDMHRAELDGEKISRFAIKMQEDIYKQN